MTCNQCGKEIGEVWEAGYIGPQDQSDVSCNPFVNFIYLCQECASD